jgi:hypothetical protein
MVSSTFKCNLNLIECASNFKHKISVKFTDFSFLVKFKGFPVIPNTVPVKFKGTAFIIFMTGVPLIIIGIPLNLKELQLKKK